ncbi:hypothetical protein LTR37_002884 [Vermiconidia calcicola]|uniref:Uncharacterized protein n=1 Tax=Vermiconidia calcicola TaxID=1690605 RepID=A0ACC3NR96_9PEZI|nr:hypothetical protein LTR37_002884 [Vermiconidia calcicola]
MSLVNVHGAHNWVRISQSIQTRSPKQCRERFHQNLKPNLNHEPITPEEGVLIEQMVAEMGKRWAEIARRLRGRSDNAVKNWWNGGMNRRRRSNNRRRTMLEVRQPSNGPAPLQSQSIPSHQYGLPSAFPHMQPQCFNHPIYHPGHAHLPQPIKVPSNGPPLRSNGLVETPLPSPSAFSQMSADGAPSLVSDTSSTSARSPHNGTSPIELPPLSGARSERRQPSAQMVQLGVPGSFVHEPNFPMDMHRFGEPAKQAPRLLEEPFMPHQQSFPQPSHYLPSQPQNPSPFQHHNGQLPASYPMSAPPPREPSGYHPVYHQMRHVLPVQLPSISSLPTLSTEGHIDPSLARCTPIPSTPTPEDSPRDKMSLSNLTH